MCDSVFAPIIPLPPLPPYVCAPQRHKVRVWWWIPWLSITSGVCFGCVEFLVGRFVYTNKNKHTHTHTHIHSNRLLFENAVVYRSLVLMCCAHNRSYVWVVCVCVCAFGQDGLKIVWANFDAARTNTLGGVRKSTFSTFRNFANFFFAEIGIFDITWFRAM